MLMKDPIATQWVALVVDDEVDNIGVAQKTLSYHGAKVYFARDGVDALNSLNRIEPTFVLLDISMPNMDGWETLRRIRADERLKLLPVIALTAHAMAGDEARMIQAGFDGYIAKPFDVFEFLPKIKAILANLKR
jgi:CheY-like chemotaxis protein